MTNVPRCYCRQVKGVTKEAEQDESVKTVHIFFMMPLTQISVSGSNMEANYTHIMAIDKTEANARYILLVSIGVITN